MFGVLVQISELILHSNISELQRVFASAANLPIANVLLFLAGIATYMVEMFNKALKRS